MASNKKQEIKEWKHGVCSISIITLHSHPVYDSEIVSQMLFGETCEILEKKNKYWHKVKTTVCKTIGWVSTNQLTYTNVNMFDKLNKKPSLSLEVCHQIFNEEKSIHIVMGSSLPLYDGLSCIMPQSKFVYNGQALHEEGMEISRELFVKLARRFLYSPEMANGRSPFGIDNVSFVHQVFRLFNLDLTRDIHLQIQQGEWVDFAQLAQIGDIAFFEDSMGNINHVGIVMGPKEIIHVYGYVRIDKFDHHGIYNKDLKKYTHKLRVIKRIIPLQRHFECSQSSHFK